MELLVSKIEDLDKVHSLVRKTIQDIYPKYYPKAIVEYFDLLHSKEKNCFRYYE